MEFQEKLSYISKSELFAGIDSRHIGEIVNNSEVVNLPKNYQIINQGNRSHSLYIIVSGKISVIKGHERPDQETSEVKLATLQLGQTFGESGLLRKNSAIADVITETESTLLYIPYTVIKSNLAVYNAVCFNIANSYSERLNSTNLATLSQYEQREVEYKKRISLGSFLINTIMAMMLYIVILTIYNSKYNTKEFNFQNNQLTVIALSGILLIYLKILNNLKIPLETCGVSLNVSRKQIIESLVYSALICVFILFLKILYLETYATASIHKIFDFYPMYDQEGNYVGITGFFISMVVYVLFIPVQEFVYRGCIQGIIQQYYLDNDIIHKWQAILISNIIFAASHAHVYSYATPVFVLGMFWGWLYSRSQNLIPTCISHIMIAIWSFFFIGFFGIIN